MANEPRYGKRITKAEADIMYERFKKIKTDSHAKITAALKSDMEAIRFYTGRKGMDPVKEDLAFVFTKHALTNVMAKILNDEADGLVLFNAARHADDSINEKGVSTDETGRPTLIMFPFKFTADANGDSIDETIEIFPDDGFEHPGTGGQSGEGGLSTGTSVSTNGPVTIPSVFKPGEVHPIL